jgi:hypothetical protein
LASRRTCGPASDAGRARQDRHCREHATTGRRNVRVRRPRVAVERDHAKREALLCKIQELSIERVMYAPVIDFRALMGIGARVSKHTIGDVWMSPFPSYEDIEIKGQLARAANGS